MKKNFTKNTKTTTGAMLAIAALLGAATVMGFSLAQSAQATAAAPPPPNANELAAETLRQQATAFKAQSVEVQATNPLLAQILRDTSIQLFERAEQLDPSGEE